ncbi:hypothetical protein RDV64_01550 [Acuticoccus sp. MNP-M23]|uniref:hypothetical protein n=1 Tax=Acuticoccus sp. MNP-M23 TaxID=3072793 RepID=UPI0028169DFF|nr:hypothetical protein [Acuticoccus sp. MNP-M23]WMS43117.1 hypothetical protein RDV64_01550 [Acuticoccus sp. MNP-M23]
MAGKTTDNEAIEVLDGLTVQAAARRAEFDVARYAALLEGSDLTEAQKGQFLEALWSIIVAFVDLGFGVHPLQQVEDGKIRSDSGDLVKCGVRNAQEKETV